MSENNPELETKDRTLFNQIASDYFKKDMLPASSMARRHRLQKSLESTGLQSTHKILEIGCGGGFSAKYLDGHYADYLGIDYAETMIEFAQKYWDLPHAKFRTINIKDLEPECNDFDLIVMIGVLHHMTDIENVLIKLKTHLKPGGKIVVNEPQPDNPLITLMRRVRKRVDPAYSNEQQELSGKKMLKAFKSAGYVSIHLHPQGFFTTPFAEVGLQPQWLMTPLAALACRLDDCLEIFFGHRLIRLGWNLVVTAENPAAGN
jgi:2-polyprenyl-3-methyl-5-hydroxy-6-metoxy-1,4-benzoquinol methylase